MSMSGEQPKQPPQKPSDEVEVYFSDSTVTLFVPSDGYGFYVDMLYSLRATPNQSYHNYTDKETRNLDHIQMRFRTPREAEIYAGEIGSLLDSFYLVRNAVESSDLHQHELEKF